MSVNESRDIGIGQCPVSVDKRREGKKGRDTGRGSAYFSLGQFFMRKYTQR